MTDGTGKQDDLKVNRNHQNPVLLSGCMDLAIQCGYIWNASAKWKPQFHARGGSERHLFLCDFYLEDTDNVFPKDCQLVILSDHLVLSYVFAQKAG